MEKVFDITRRLGTWKRNNEQWANPKSNYQTQMPTQYGDSQNRPVKSKEEIEADLEQEARIRQYYQDAKKQPKKPQTIKGIGTRLRENDYKT